MDNKLVMISIAAVIGIIVLGSVLMPILDDATAKEDTFENDGYFKLQKYTDNLTFSWSLNAPGVYHVNDEVVEYVNDTNLSISVILGQKFAVRVSNNNVIGYFGGGLYLSPSVDHPDITASLSSGTFTISNGDVTRTISNVSEIYAISNDGDYTMKKTDSIAYLNSGSEVIADSEIYASGQTFSGSTYIFWHMEGTVDNMEYPNVFDTNLTITNQDINGEYNSDHIDLYELQNITFTATTSTNVVYNVTASYFVVPTEVTAERSVHFTDGQNAIFAAIPVMIILAVLLGVVALVIRSRMD